LPRDFDIGNARTLAAYKRAIELPDVGDWKCAVDDEIERLGVFNLSYLEMLVRIADRRASALREIKS
jgi:hypothetical protein